jgi:mannitol-1-phosphate/altronate dehydrogenase
MKSIKDRYQSTASSETTSASARLSAALESVLEMIDELPVTVDPFHQLVVDNARRALDETGWLRPVTR